MGRISYGVYLIHIPVLFSFGCWFFLLIFGYTGNYQLTSVIAFVVTMAVIILLAWAFNSLVEKNIGKILKKIFG
jgi:peptidoglycan/LPS O-acetylase OafA/YrhL